MIDANHRQLNTTAATPAAEVDLGLRSFLLGVLTKTALGLLLSAGVAFLVASIPGVRDELLGVQEVEGVRRVSLTGLGMIVMISPVAALLVFGAGKQTRARSALLFWSFAAGIGASASVLAVVYTGLSIATAFAGAAAGFGAFSLFGYTTRRDLTPAGAFFTTGLVGLLVAMALNLMLGSAALAFAITIIGVIVFAGLIAYDLQRLKLVYDQARESETSLAVATNTGALCLFLDFVNLFQFLLMALGQRR